LLQLFLLRKAKTTIKQPRINKMSIMLDVNAFVLLRGVLLMQDSEPSYNSDEVK